MLNYIINTIPLLVMILLNHNNRENESHILYRCFKY
nr:MAG TPA: hypothetical protein [Caudoviricetes sp.]